MSLIGQHGDRAVNNASPDHHEAQQVEIEAANLVSSFVCLIAVACGTISIRRSAGGGAGLYQTYDLEAVNEFKQSLKLKIKM